MFLDRWLGRPTGAVARLVQAGLMASGDRFHRDLDRACRGFRKTIASLDDALLAVKLINLMIARHEYARRSVATIARPVGFMMDPANQCQLACPSCTNSANEEYTRSFNRWPRGTMTPETYSGFLDAVGLSAFCGHFYNNHEPFLNRHTPDFIAAASALRIQTFVSSNLSYAKLDVEAIVRSGLRELMVAIDGTTQPVYERYRKRGRLDWVLANARAIADAKRKLNSPTPYLRWQFLSFAHNVEQVPDAIALAQEIGFDTFNVATPFNVAQDDPTVIAIAYAGPAAHSAVVFRDRPPAPFTSDLEPYRDRILSRLDDSAEARWAAVRGDDRPASQSGPADRCDWLHLAVIGDAMGRIVPCCLGDYVNQGQFVFATIDTHADNLMNSPAYREAFKQVHPSQRVRCNKCPIRPLPQIGLGAVDAYFAMGNNLAAAALTARQRAALTGFSAHREHAPGFTPA